MSTFNQVSVGKEKAIAMADSLWWEGMPAKEAAKIMLTICELCVPNTIFHRTMESALGRTVFASEFASLDILWEELVGNRPSPTFDEIIKMLPQGKELLVVSR